MKSMNEQTIQAILQKIGDKNQITVGQVQQKMQQAIDAAYESRHLSGHEGFLTLFGDSKPSLAEFLSVVADLADQADM